MAERVILYVEDDPEDIRTAEALFTRLKVNYTLHAVFGGREAMDRLKNQGRFTDRNRYPIPEIILVDITMPDIDGFELLQLVKREADFRSIPVFILSGSNNSPFREKANALGAAGYIQKSWSIRSFVESLKYINTQLMAAVKYSLLIHFEGEGQGPSELS